MPAEGGWSALRIDKMLECYRRLTPCSYCESQMSACILHLSVITHDQASSYPSSSKNKRIPEEEPNFDAWDRSAGVNWVQVCRYISGRARTSSETSVQDPVRRSFLTQIEGSAGPGEIVMPAAVTGAQACEWRLVGVARQFEVYCV